jgi:hypothetical protein
LWREPLGQDIDTESIFWPVNFGLNLVAPDKIRDVRAAVRGRLKSLAKYLVQVQADLAVGHTLYGLVEVYSYLHHECKEVGIHVAELFLHLIGAREQLRTVEQRADCERGLVKQTECLVKSI